MRRWSYFLALILLGFGLTVDEALGCSCAPPPPHATAAQLTEWRNRGITAIFEATVEEARMKSPLTDAAVGTIVPASLEENPPVISVTFGDTHFYKGSQKQTVEVETGLGGGDCGYQFELKRRYLVYAYEDQNGQFSTGICTATAAIEESGARLAQLRGERVVPVTSQDVHPTSSSRLCGRVIQDDQHGPGVDAKIMFFRDGSASPMPYDEAEPDEKGNFCADLDRGEYRFVFTNTGEESVTSYVYYPGTVEASEAAEITINSGENISDLLFRIPAQETFSVSGVVSLSDNFKVPNDTKVVLISADRPFQGPAYEQDVASDGTFTLPTVLPGRYWGVLDVDSVNDSTNVKWSTVKTEVLVSGNVDHLSLQLIRN